MNDQEKQTLVNDPNKIWVTVERRVNLGNYEGITLSVGESRTVGPEDDPAGLRDEVTAQCLEEIENFVEDYK